MARQPLPQLPPVTQQVDLPAQDASGSERPDASVEPHPTCATCTRRFKTAFNTAMLLRVCFTLLAAGRATTTRCCRTACTTAIAPWTPRSAGPPFPSPRRRPRAHSPVHDCKPAVPPVQKSCVDPDSRLLPRAEWRELHPEIQSDIFNTRLIVVPERATLTQNQVAERVLVVSNVGRSSACLRRALWNLFTNV